MIRVPNALRSAVAAVALMAASAPATGRASSVEFNLEWHLQLHGPWPFVLCSDTAYGSWTPDGASQSFRIKKAGGVAWLSLLTFLDLGHCWDHGPQYHEGYLETPFTSDIVATGQNKVQFTDFTGSVSSASTPYLFVESDVFLEAAHFHAPRLVHSQYRGLHPTQNVTSEFNLSLTFFDLKPDVAADIENLQDELDALQGQLVALAASAEGADAKIARLEELRLALDALFAQGFDDLTVDALAALLGEYADVLGPGGVAALEMLLSDYKSDIDDLIQQLGETLDQFRDDAAAMAGLVSGPAEQDGFELSQPENYTDQHSTNNIPEVDAPELPGDEFDPNNDPYAAYADQVIANLQTTITDGVVVSRSEFLDIANGWVANHAALKDVLQARGDVSPAEWEAFVGAEHRVLTFIQQYLDVDGWFRDSPVPQRVRAFVDMGIAMYSLEKSQMLKAALSRWKGQLTTEQKAWVNLLLLLESAWEEVRTVPPEADKDIWDTFGELADGAVTLVTIGLEFTPLGDVKDACELLTGWENCNPAGRSLTYKERLLAGAGLVLGSGAMWRRAGGAIDDAGGVAAKKLGDALDEVKIRAPSSSNPNIVEIVDLPGGAKRYRHVDGYEVVYDSRGFPDFTPYLRPMTDGKKNTVVIDLAAPPNRTEDFRRANIEAGFGNVATSPPGYTWHHNEELGVMQLVEKDVHQAFGHTGGFKYWEIIWEFTE
jgi:hypothetical protein